LRILAAQIATQLAPPQGFPKGKDEHLEHWERAFNTVLKCLEGKADGD